ALRPPSTRSALPSAVFSAGRIVSKRLPIDLAAGRAGGGGVRVARLQPPVDGLGLPPQVLRRGHGTALPRLVPAGPSTSPSVTSPAPAAEISLPSLSHRGQQPPRSQARTAGAGTPATLDRLARWPTARP